MDQVEILLRRKNKVVVERIHSTPQISQIQIATLNKNLEPLGYILSPEVVRELSYLGLTELFELHTRIISILKTLKGVKDYKPMYPNFPQQVMDMSEYELYSNAFLHYFSSWIVDCTGNSDYIWTPTYDKITRQPLEDKVKLTVWHGWMGHDPHVRVSHVPGHELAGVVEEVGKNVSRWTRRDRVTVPFVCGCGKCPQCASGNHQVCDHQFQPGFTHWGAFAEYVASERADTNLVGLPLEVDFVTAAVLGCRFMTSFRAIVAQGRVLPGQWVAVHGCGGVGLSAIMIASAIGAQVIGVDISDRTLGLAKTLGATVTLNAGNEKDIPKAVQDISGGGAHMSIDALGSTVTCRNSILCLRKRGRHVQVGLMVGDDSEPSLPMGPVIGRELELLGSHGMQAHRYPELLQMIVSGKLRPEMLLGKTVSLGFGASWTRSASSLRNSTRIFKEGESG